MRGKCQTMNVTSSKVTETSDDRRNVVQHWSIYVHDLLQGTLDFQNSKLNHRQPWTDTGRQVGGRAGGRSGGRAGGRAGFGCAGGRVVSERAGGCAGG